MAAHCSFCGTNSKKRRATVAGPYHNFESGTRLPFDQAAICNECLTLALSSMVKDLKVRKSLKRIMAVA